MARGVALAAAIAVSLLAVSGAGGADAQSPKRGGAVVLGAPPSPLFQEPACLNVLLERCSGLLGTISTRVLEPLFDAGPDLTWRPRLVTHVDFTRSAPFTLTYHLRPQARWSDGVPVTARDVVFTHEAIIRGLPRGLGAMHRDAVRSVRALDSKTVRVVLRSRFSGWRGLFGNILPSHVLRGRSLAGIWVDRIDDPGTGRSIASGPFVFERWDRGRQLVLRRNPTFWGSHTAYVERLVFDLRASGIDLPALLGSGSLDLAWGFTPAVAEALVDDRTLRVHSTPGSGFDHFDIRVGAGGHPALREKLVRRALAYGNDRVGLVRRLLGGSPRFQQLDSLVFPTASKYYRANWALYRYRPQESQRLLRQAGCARGDDGIFSCRGQRLRLRFVTTGIPGGYRAQLLELVPAQLRAAGFEAVSTFATTSAFFGQIIPGGEFDLALFAFVVGPEPAPKPRFGCSGPENVTGYCQRLVTADLDQADRILDADRQARVLNRVDARLAQDVPAIPFAQQPQSAAHRARLRGFELSPNAQLNFLWGAENWWLAE